MLFQHSIPLCTMQGCQLLTLLYNTGDKCCRQKNSHHHKHLQRMLLRITFVYTNITQTLLYCFHPREGKPHQNMYLFSIHSYDNSTCTYITLHTLDNKHCCGHIFRNLECNTSSGYISAPAHPNVSTLLASEQLF